MNNSPFISMLKTPRFLAKEYFHRRPDASYRPDYVDGQKRTEAEAAAAVLKQDGIVMFPGYFAGAKLAELQKTFADSTKGRVGNNANSLYNEDLLVDFPLLMETALDNYLLQIIGSYYGKRFGLARAQALSLAPSPDDRQGSFQWHHDTRGRQVHMMVLLSEVTDKGQKMTYLKESQHRYYTHYRGIVRSRFDEDVAADPTAKNRMVDVTGPAGTVAIFDANGLHSGNRSPHEPRDTLTYVYVSWAGSGRHYKAARVRKSDLQSLAPNRRDVIEYNPRLEVVS